GDGRAGRCWALGESGDAMGESGDVLGYWAIVWALGLVGYFNASTKCNARANLNAQCEEKSQVQLYQILRAIRLVWRPSRRSASERRESRQGAGNSGTDQRAAASCRRSRHGGSGSGPFAEPQRRVGSVEVRWSVGDESNRSDLSDHRQES